MKSKILTLLCLLALQMNSVSGKSTDAILISKKTDQNPPSSVFKKVSPLLETKASYLFFTSSQTNHVYPNGGFQIQVSGSYPIWKGLHVYGSAGFSEAWGHSQSFHQNTSLWQLSVDLGLKPIFTIASFAQYYLAIGPRYFYAHQHNDSTYVTPVIARSGAGLFTNTGFNFYPRSHLLINIFGEYAYEPVHFSSKRLYVYGRSTQLSFFSFGAGIGYAF